MTGTESSAYFLEHIRFAYPGAAGRFTFELDSLHVEPGSVLALVGPNGAGKTTLLMLLALLLRPSEGRVAFFGRNAWESGWAERPLARRDAVLVTHHPYLFKGTVGDNLAFGLKVRGVPESEWPSRMADALTLVELPGWEGKQAAGLSAGQAQRIALARGLVLRPKVLLLDEPTANIEAGLSLRIEAVIGEFVREIGTTVIFSTHNTSQASRLAGSILYLSEGKQVPFSHENCFSGTAATDSVRSWIEPRPGIRIVFTGARRGHVTCVINPAKIRLEGEALTRDFDTRLSAAETDPQKKSGAPAADPASVNVFRGVVSRLEMTEGGQALIRIAGDLTFRAVCPLTEVEEKRIALSRPVLVRFDPQDVELIGTPPAENTT